ncbi:cobyrinate a,c-diamide synthase [Candidatus Formimonas warabiya]|uniref:Cobyrinate a,c-diamide synthase n=1 Tax=Formimonas warabiya TaxID=1761012 RepID=A0A3G1L016_FORW1|nr:cobyrinate a,c-diamide synthase [Candidatus Formimonas warabiya]ATW28123.1 hypothetical protein DCMF_28240 [Candidatus Formimonas warabiya]
MDEKKRGVLPRLVISAPASGSGKTTFSMGLMAAYCRQGLSVQPFKVGPDYIDPAFHTAITGRNSVNLDGWMLDERSIKQMFVRYAQGVDLSLVEGVMGLYDGYGDDPFQGSTAGIARILDAPIVLIMTAQGMAASAAAVLYGLKEFGKANIAGVIINQPSSPNHYRTIKQAVENHTGIKVAGFLPKTSGVALKSRHLGLVQSSETENLAGIVDRLADLMQDHIDLDFLLTTAKQSPLWDREELPSCQSEPEEMNIAIAWDKAFSFYYYENLEILRRLGAHLKFFSPIHDISVPEDCSGVYFGGGYPEVFAEEVAANTLLKKDIREKAEAGLPMFGECGGYMYLNRSFTRTDGKTFEFVGIFDGATVLTERLQHFGYLELEGLVDTVMFQKGDRIRAHEFHKSLIQRTDVDYCVKAQKIKNGQMVEWQCGRAYKNVFGMYPHIYFPSNMNFAHNFISRCREYQRK